MTQPDPDPTNREQIVRVLAQFQDQRLPPAIRLTVPELLDALDASGYQIVPKVELEGLRQAGVAALSEIRHTPECRDVYEKCGCTCAARTVYDALAAALQALDKENAMIAELPEHLRYERWDATLRGVDGTLATHHDDPCILCERLALSQELKAAREERDRLVSHNAWLRERLPEWAERTHAAEAEVHRLRGALAVRTAIAAAALTEPEEGEKK